MQVTILHYWFLLSVFAKNILQHVCSLWPTRVRFLHSWAVWCHPASRNRWTASYTSYGYSYVRCLDWSSFFFFVVFEWSTGTSESVLVWRVETRCITLQHTASHCSTLYHTATYCKTLTHTATHCNTSNWYTVLIWRKEFLKPGCRFQVVPWGRESKFAYRVAKIHRMP